MLAVGIATSFTADSLHNGRLYRPGEIVDADMIFNPQKVYTTPSSGGFGTDLQSVATHEGGHLYGISHSAVPKSTMFYVLPPNTEAASLETEDELVFIKAYPSAATMANSNQISGTVTDGSLGAPVPGAIVFVIDAVAGDTVGCDYTLPDGSYKFVGVPDGSYFVSIYPINGTSPIGFLQPSYINDLIATTAQTLFVPESWDANESNLDDPTAQNAITVNGGTLATADLVTNIDATPPTVTQTTPNNGATGVRIDGAVILRFSESIDTGTLVANFTFVESVSGTGIGGNIAVLNDDSLIVFTPSAPLQFNTPHRLTLNTGLTDVFGNGLAAPFVLDYTTEPEPPISISSLAPNKGLQNATVAINGQGFDVSPPPAVDFNGMPALVVSGSPNQLVVKAPVGVTTGPVTVTNADLSQSNAITFTVLSQEEVARGTIEAQVDLADRANDLALIPDGSYAYAATEGGVEAIGIDPAITDYLVKTSIPYPAGLTAVAANAVGDRVFGVSEASGELVEINSDPNAGLLL